MDTRARIRPRAGLPLALWYYLRISSLAMIGLVIGHLYIMHILNTTDTIDYAFVANRFATPLWRIYDLLILIFALSHGLVGLRGILDDYVAHPAWRLILETAMWVVGVVFFVIGAVVLVTFQPDRGF